MPGQVAFVARIGVHEIEPAVDDCRWVVAQPGSEFVDLDEQRMSITVYHRYIRVIVRCPTCTLANPCRQ